MPPHDTKERQYHEEWLEESLSQETITAEDGIYSQYRNELAFEAALLLLGL